MPIDRDEAAIILEGLRLKHEALAKTDYVFNEIHQQIVDALSAALKALEGGEIVEAGDDIPCTRV